MILTAPWTEAQVEALRCWQANDWVHPFTCPNPHLPSVLRVLTPTRSGWACLVCGYTQNWAHGFMLGAGRTPAHP